MITEYKLIKLYRYGNYIILIINTDGDIKYPSIPDYSQKQLLYSGVVEWQESFVASKNGLLTCTGWGTKQSNSYIEYRINGVIYEHQGNSNEAINCTVPIKKGDTVLIHVFLASNNYGVYFIPFI